MRKFNSFKVSFITLIGVFLLSFVLFLNSRTTTQADSDDNTTHVIVCHKDGQSGNYSRVDVSVHSVSDANGLNGHGNHNSDVWAPFTYNGHNYSGQGNYSSFNFNNCSQSTPTPTPTQRPTSTPTATPTPTIKPTATPTPTPTSTPSPTPTPTATPTPTIDPCFDRQCPTSTPTPTATPTVVPTATPTSSNNGNGGSGVSDGLGCANHDCSGNKVGSSVTQGQGQVLGASTMAGTGSFEESFYQAIMSIGATLSAFGIKGLKKGKKNLSKKK